MGRFFVYAVLLWIAYFLVKKVGRSFFSSETPQRGAPGAPTPEAELIRDPECGTYFMKSKGIKGVVEGKVMHFCTEECYDKYRKSHAR